MLSQETQPHTLSQDTLLQDTRLLDTGMLSQDAYSHMLSQDTQSQDTDMLSQDTLSLASFPGPTPFWRGIGPGKVSAVCVFTLGRTKKCAANQITVLKHVKLTCDSCSLRRVSTECVQSFTAPWQWETFVVFATSQQLLSFGSWKFEMLAHRKHD